MISKSAIIRFAAIGGLTAVLSSCAVKPTPYSEGQLQTLANHDAAMIFHSQEPVDSPLSLHEAMARALKYNLDHRVSMMEMALAQQNVDLAKTDMLPSLAATAGYLDRSNENASRSISVLTRRESLEPSTSQEQERVNADLRFSWNLLDFGVSYLQAKQETNTYLISGQTRKKVMLNLMQRVRSAYWRAVAMNSMRDELEVITHKTEAMLDNLEQVRAEQLRTPVAILIDIRTLVETSQQLDQIRHSINLASTELASLINVPVKTTLPLEKHEALAPIPVLERDLAELEKRALVNSADYVSQSYKVEIEHLETRKAMARLLPGLEFSYGGYYNSNSFLWNNQWGELGIRLTGNITQLLYQDKIRDNREVSEQLALTRRLATNMAVVATVHLSWQQYANAVQTLQRAGTLNDIDQEISRLTTSARSSDAASGVEAIQNEFRAFRSKMGRMLSYAEAQDSFGYFLVSVGVDPVPQDYQSYTVDELTEALENGFSQALGELAAPEGTLETTMETPHLTPPPTRKEWNLR